MNLPSTLRGDLSTDRCLTRGDERSSADLLGKLLQERVLVLVLVHEAPIHRLLRAPDRLFLGLDLLVSSFSAQLLPPHSGIVALVVGPAGHLATASGVAPR